MSCNICVTSFNNSKHLCIVCPYCEFESCRLCCETYLVNSNQEADCMNCKHNWDYKTLVDLFTRKFVDNVYKAHTETMLLQQEMALLPATQPIIEEQRRKKKLIESISEIDDQIRDLQFQIAEKKKELSTSGTYKMNTVIRRCHYNNCKGFLNSEWKCGICEMQSCCDCHEVIEKDHICKQDAIETVKLLDKDTKPCPKCAIPIFKIEGCDQMYCTQCHTAFSWKTGNIQRGVIHNPHYFEWLRLNGRPERNPLEVRCGREIDDNFISNIRDICSKSLVLACRNVIHIHYVELPRYIINTTNNNQDLRIKYLNGELSQDRFKQILQKRNRERSKKQELADILNMYVNSFTEILYRYEYEYSDKYGMVADQYITERIEYKYIQELWALMEYTNNCFDNVSRLYKSTNYQIDTDHLNFSSLYSR